MPDGLPPQPIAPTTNCLRRHPHQAPSAKKGGCYRPRRFNGGSLFLPGPFHEKAFRHILLEHHRETLTMAHPFKQEEYFILSLR